MATATRAYDLGHAESGGAGIQYPARLPCVLYHVLLVGLVVALAIARVIPWTVLLAFAPALCRAAVGIRRKQAAHSPRRLGWSEAALATAFVVLLIGTF